MLARNRFLGCVKCVCLAAVLGTVGLTASTASAGLMYWGGATGANWSDNKWSGADGGPYSSAWVDGSSARLNSAGPVTLNVTSPVSLCGISFGDTGYQISGGTLTLTGGTAGFTLNGIYYANAIGMGGTSNNSGISSDIAGTGDLNKGGSGTVEINGACTYSGNTNDLYGPLYFSSTSSLLLSASNSGASTKVYSSLTSRPSAAVVTLNGLLKVDVSAVTDHTGTWTLIDGANLDGLNYGSYFAVQLANGTSFVNSSGVWTATEGLRTWTFTQSNGQLGLTTAAPKPGVIVLIGTGLLGLLAYAWRHRK
jgi:autotransporter-associated beta strand protein